jgi:hypothetical protein
MKRALHVFTYLTIVLLFISFKTTKAQGVKQSWDFEVNKDIWNAGDGAPVLTISTDHAFTGTHSLKVAVSNTSNAATIQNDGYKPLAGEIITYRVWVSAADTANINGLQIFYQDGGGSWTWHSQWINGTDIKGDQWNTLSYTMPAYTPALDRIGIQFLQKSNATPVYYIDDITISGFPFPISSWGFFGGKNGGNWKYSTDGIVGDGTISGTKGPAGWAVIRGGFDGTVTPTTSKALIVKGTMELVGGGFESWSSLNLGLFYNSNPGKVDTSAGLSSANWTGTDNNELGYLVTPHSDKLPNETYGLVNMSSVGAIVNEAWLNTSGASPFDANNGNYILSGNPQNPADAVGGAGIYDFAISVEPLVNGRTELRYQIQKQDKSYNFAGTIIDGHMPAKMTQFNGIHFAINNPTTTALILKSVMVDLGSPITISNSYHLTSVNSIDNGIPTNYSLSQNYPNPFNPTTNIEFALPKNSNVKLVVYDVLGKVVTELVNKDLNAGNYKFNFNASNLASGIYFYSLKAGDFVNVKKLMLLK